MNIYIYTKPDLCPLITDTNANINEYIFICVLLLLRGYKRRRSKFLWLLMKVFSASATHTTNIGQFPRLEIAQLTYP